MLKISAAALCAAIAISAATPVQANNGWVAPFVGGMVAGAIFSHPAPRYYAPPPVYYPPTIYYYPVPACDTGMYPYGCPGPRQQGSYPYITNSWGQR